MNIAKFLKGTTTFGELENMPNRYIQVFYKEYINMLKDAEKREAHEAEQIQDEIEDEIGG